MKVYEWDDKILQVLGREVNMHKISMKKCIILESLLCALWGFPGGSDSLIPESGRSPGEGNGNPL